MLRRRGAAVLLIIASFMPSMSVPSVAPWFSIETEGLLGPPLCC